MNLFISLQSGVMPGLGPDRCGDRATTCLSSQTQRMSWGTEEATGPEQRRLASGPAMLEPHLLSHLEEP